VSCVRRRRVVVFPGLSLTGYELDAAPVACGHDVWIPIIDACATAGSLALVGAPVEEQGRRFIAMLVVDGAGARPAYRKTSAGRQRIDAVPTRWRADGAGGRRVRLGLGICRDSGAAQHVAGSRHWTSTPTLQGSHTGRRSSRSKRPGPSSSPAPAGRWVTSKLRSRRPGAAVALSWSDGRVMTAR